MHKKSLLFHFSLLGAFGMAGMFPAIASAQSADATTDPGEEVETVVVTGFRAALQSAADAKRDAITITDSVFAEDIGKFPDLNIAESLNRVPGVLLTREVNGEGLNISIRGLGTSFTKTVINGAQISVASSGRADSQNTNREVDLDLFPTELFSRLDVHKSPTASMLEGGVVRRRRHAHAAPVRQSGLARHLPAAGRLRRDQWRGEPARRGHRQLDQRHVWRVARPVRSRQPLPHQGFRNHRLDECHADRRAVRRGHATHGSESLQRRADTRQRLQHSQHGACRLPVAASSPERPSMRHSCWRTIRASRWSSSATRSFRVSRGPQISTASASGIPDCCRSSTVRPTRCAFTWTPCIRRRIANSSVST